MPTKKELSPIQKEKQELGKFINMLAGTDEFMKLVNLFKTENSSIDIEKLTKALNNNTLKLKQIDNSIKKQFNILIAKINLLPTKK